jgi:hypothetical protein
MGQNPAFIKTFTQNLASGALSYTFTLNATNLGYANPTWALQEVLIGFSVAESETVTVSYVNAAGASYTIVLDSTTLSSSKNYVFRPSTMVLANVGDSIVVTCTNANSTGVAYGVLKLLPVCSL